MNDPTATLRAAEYRAGTTGTGGGSGLTSPKRGSSSSGRGLSTLGIIGIVVGFVVIIVIVILATSIPSIVWNSKQTTVTSHMVLNATTGQCYCRDGLPGAPGQQGPPGESVSGPQGPPGQQGPSGVAMCIASPSCASGPSGPKGEQGAKGAQGNRGFPGETGPQGAAGPSGAQGDQGPVGATGPQGDQGIQGPNGTCDCFNLPNVTINTTYVTGLLDVQGNLTCATSTSISPTCFPNACLNFSQCNLVARSLQLVDGSPTALIVGRVGDGGTSSVIFGSSSAGNATVPWIMQLFQTYATTTTIDASVYTQIRTLAGDMLIQVLGSFANVLTLASQGQIQLQSQGALTLQTLGVGDITLQTSSVTNRVNLLAPGGILGITSSFNMSTQTYLITAGGTNVYVAGTQSTLICGTTIPAPLDATANSNVYSQDIVMTNGAQIISAENSGLVSIGPGVSLCGGIITAPGGLITVQGSITSSGSCCTSDARVKENVRPLDDEEALRLVRKARPVRFDWTPEFRETDGWAKQHPTNVFGFLAQDLETFYPQAITFVNKTVGSKRIEDFRFFNKDELVPITVGALKALDTRIRQMERQVLLLLRLARKKKKTTHRL